MKTNFCVFLLVSFTSLIIGNLISQPTFGQSDAPYANCIMFKDNGYNVILQMDDDCDSAQFSEASNYYKSNGYHEVGYSNIAGTQMIHLKK